MKYIERNDCVRDNTYNYNEYLFYLYKIFHLFVQRNIYEWVHFFLYNNEYR